MIANSTISSRGSEPLPSATTEDSKAYEYFLRGRGYSISGAERDRELAAEMFGKAVDIDPKFLRAWVHLAEECAFIANFFSRDSKWPRLGQKAADNAMQLAPGDAAGFLARGYAYSADQRFAESEQALRKAVELDSGLSRAWHHLARAEQHQGKIKQAIASFENATKLDPDDFESPLLATTMYFATGDDDGARRVAEIGVERAKRVLRDYPDNQRAYYLGSGGLFILEQHDIAKEWAERALELNPDDAATRYNSACFFSKYGEIDRCLDLLEGSVISRTWIENDSDLDPLRDHPRFQVIVDSLPE
jgi:adenylate cyclase